MYTIPAKTTVQTKTIISAFEKGHVKSLNIADNDEVDQSKPQHPELCREELAEPGTAKKLLLAFESKRAESQKTSSAGKTPPATKLSLDKFSTFGDKTVAVKVEKQVNGSAVNGSAEVDVVAVIKVEKTEVISNADVKATTADVQIEKKTIEISKDNTVNGDSATLHIESTTISATKAHESVQEIKHDEVKKEIVEEVESRVEEKIETAVERAVQEKVEEKIEEKISDRIEKTVENSKDAKEISIDVKLTVASDSDEQTKVAEKIEEKIEEKVKEKVQEHVEKKLEHHNGVADKVEAKIEEKVRENVEDNIEEIVRENLKEKVIDSKEEKIAKKLSDEDKKITVSVSVTKSSEESSEVANGAAVTHAVKVGQPKMALIVSAVRTEGGLDATLRYASMKALEDQGLNVLYTDAHNISRSKSGGPDFEAEREKLLQAELIILHFRPILNSPPAALKLWLEGTLIQSSGKFIDKSLLKGKKAIILVTTDADQVPDEKLINLPFLASVQDDILRAIDMNVISPFLIFEAGEGLNEIVQRKHVDAWVTKLASALL